MKRRYSINLDHQLKEIVQGYDQRYTVDGGFQHLEELSNDLELYIEYTKELGQLTFEHMRH